MKRRLFRSARATSVARLGLATKIAIGVGSAVLILGAIFWASQENRQTQPSGQGSGQAQSAVQTGPAGKYAYQVGKPGPGEAAPPIRLASTSGDGFDLASQRGTIVLLYFQEGVTCQPCWDQLKDIESNIQQLRALGITEVVSITTDPLDVLKEKVANDRLSTPVLSDPDLAVSRSYDANSYGMMGKSRDGHTFILVGLDGRILWRADYGGAPKYTMYLPVADLKADMLQGLRKAQ